MDRLRSSEPSDRGLDEAFMLRALALARVGAWSAPPNPPVGAIVVAAGEVVGEGSHLHRGGPHAEVIALDAAGTRARGATLYVTLEPCNHQGRTPPCTRAILQAGIARVVIALLDPDRRQEGGGAERLEAEGVELEVGPEAEPVQELLGRHLEVVGSDRPFLIAKSARTLDGRTGRPGPGPLVVTGPEAMAWTARRRTEVAAIMVGSGTILSDDPRLNARDRSGDLLRPQPVRIIADGALRTPPSSRVLATEGGPVLILTAPGCATGEAADALRERGARLVEIERGADGRLDPDGMLAAVAAEGIRSILIEGGGTLLEGFAERGLIDLWHFLIAPRVVGAGPGVLREGLPGPIRLGALQTESLGEDLLVSALPGSRVRMEAV